jgi:zinc protease
MNYWILTLLFLTTSANAIEVVFEQDTNLPIAYVNFAIKTGSVSDPKGQSGLTNFMGEMLVRGTKLRTKEQINLAIDQMGASIEIDSRTESTIIRTAVLSSQLKPFLKLVKEVITEPTFPENEIRKLKSEISAGILEELGQDMSLGKRRFTQNLFKNHPYSNPLMGKLKDIENLKRDQVVRHYNNLFQDSLFLVVGTGDADPTYIADWARGLVKDLKTKSEPIPALTEPKLATTKRLVIIDKPDRTQTQILIGHGGPLLKDHKFFPLHVGNQAFGGSSFLSRLMQEIREKRGWSYGASARFEHGTQPRSWTVHLFPASKDTPDALALTLKLISDLQKDGITSQEFTMFQEKIVNSAGFMFNTAAKRVENKLMEKTLGLPDGFYEKYGENTKKVTLEQTNVAIKSFVKPNELLIMVLGTAKDLKEKLATAAGVPVSQIEVIPYTLE